MKLGANSVLFGGFDMETAFLSLSMAGYDGIELSAIGGMSEHLVLDRWQEVAPEIRRLSEVYGLELLAMEQPSQDPQIMEAAFQAASEIGIPIINCGPGGKSGDLESLQQSIDSIGNLVRGAEKYGVTLCVKAHVGSSIDNTETTLQIMAAIDSPNFGIDMDPSHIHRAGENPVDALQAVISRVKHVHIRDCKGMQQGPGAPETTSERSRRHRSSRLHTSALRKRIRRSRRSGNHRRKGVHPRTVLRHCRRVARPYAGMPPSLWRSLNRNH